MSDSVRPHRWQPTRFPRLWDSPGKNTGVGCHFLPQCMKVKSESEVAQSYLTLSDPMDCSLPGSIIHRIFQARVLELAPFHGLWQKTWDWVQSLRTVLLTSIAVTEISISVSYPSSSPTGQHKEERVIPTHVAGLRERNLLGGDPDSYNIRGISMPVQSPQDCKAIQPIYPRGNQP